MNAPPGTHITAGHALPTHCQTLSSLVSHQHWYLSGHRHLGLLALRSILPRICLRVCRRLTRPVCPFRSPQAWIFQQTVLLALRISARFKPFVGNGKHVSLFLKADSWLGYEVAWLRWSDWEHSDDG